ncbi:MAG: hypothetical protein V4662_17665 [Verrucomicrobiota bacterium]
MKKKLSSSAVIAWLGKDRYARLGDGRDAKLKIVVTSSLNVPTAAIRLLQRCDVMPSEDDVARWQQDTAPAAPVNEPSTSV